MVHEYKLQNFPMCERTGPGRDEAKMGQLIANHNAVEWKRAEKIGGAMMVKKGGIVAV